ncbi:MAG: hypothetical protein WB699_10840 [Bacteroidota bacterium]
MALPTINELENNLDWSDGRMNELEAQCESWRNKALLAEARLKVLEAENSELRQKLSWSLPLYDPDVFITPKA